LGGARATRPAATLGQAFAFALGFLGLFGNPLLIFIAIFVYIAAAGEAQMTAFTEAAQGLFANDAMTTRFKALPVDAKLGAAIEALLATEQREFPIVDTHGKPVGLLVRDDIVAAVADHHETEPVAPFMHAPIETIRDTAPLEGLLDRVFGQGDDALVVVDRDGRLAGLLTRENLMELIMIRSRRPDWVLARAARNGPK
jgi:CBS domain-containing protein